IAERSDRQSLVQIEKISDDLVVFGIELLGQIRISVLVQRRFSARVEIIFPYDVAAIVVFVSEARIPVLVEDRLVIDSKIGLRNQVTLVIVKCAGPMPALFAQGRLAVRVEVPEVDFVPEWVILPMLRGVAVSPVERPAVSAQERFFRTGLVFVVFERHRAYPAPKRDLIAALVYLDLARDKSIGRIGIALAVAALCVSTRRSAVVPIDPLYDKAVVGKLDLMPRDVGRPRSRILRCSGE